MNGQLGINLEWLQRAAAPGLPLLADASVKGFVLLLLTWGITQAMRRASAVSRQVVWLLALASLLAMPMLSAGLPSWRVLPDWLRVEATTPAPTLAVAKAGKLASLAPAKAGQDVARPTRQMAPEKQPPIPEKQPPIKGPILNKDHAEPSPAQAAAAPPVTPLVAKDSAGRGSWTARLLAWVLPAWAAGVAVCLVPLVLGRLSLWRLERSAVRITSGTWSTLLARAMAELRLTRPVVLLESPRRAMPMVWGLWKVRLLVPAEAAAWSADRRYVVLLHELAHAKRHDCLAKLLAGLVAAVYWFNPLVWMAAKRMQIEAEAACDNLVLAGGNKASDYAEHLLEIASGLRAGMLAAYGSIAMARPSRLENRLLAILDDRRNRRRLTAAGIALASLLVAGLVLPLSVLKASASRIKSKTDSDANKTFYRGDSDPWKVRLPSGVTVELAGVAEHPYEGKSYWKPDGTPLPQTPLARTCRFPRYPIDETLQAYQFALSITNLPNNDSVGMQPVIPESLHTHAGASLYGPYGSSKTSCVGIFEEGMNRTTFQFGIATGPWETIGSVGPDWSRTTSSIIFSDIIQRENGGVVVYVTHNIRDMDLRFVAIDANDEENACSARAIGSIACQSRGYFSKFKRDAIKEIHFQARPFEWVEFSDIVLPPRNDTYVSLSPDIGSSPAIQTVAGKTVALRIGPDYCQFQGQRCAWDGLVALLNDVPDKANTIIEVAAGTGSMLVDDFWKAWNRVKILAKPLGYAGTRYVDSSSGSDPAIHDISNQTSYTTSPKGNYRRVRLVVGKDRMTFEGKDVTWEQLAALIEALPAKSITELAVAGASGELTMDRYEAAIAQAARLAAKYELQKLSRIGNFPLGSRGMEVLEMFGVKSQRVETTEVMSTAGRKAILPNGVTVELTDATAVASFWSTPDNGPPQRGARWRFAVRVNGQPQSPLGGIWHIIPNGNNDELILQDKQAAMGTERAMDYIQYSTADTIRIRYGTPMGDWLSAEGRDIAIKDLRMTNASKSETASGDGALKKKLIDFKLVHNYIDRELRLLAIDDAGEKYEPTGIMNLYDFPSPFNTTYLYFEELQSARIKETQVQYRKFQWVEFVLPVSQLEQNETVNAESPGPNLPAISPATQPAVAAN